MPKYLWTRNGTDVFVNDSAESYVPPVTPAAFPSMAPNRLLLVNPAAIAAPAEGEIIPYVHPVDPNAPLGSFQNPYPYAGRHEPEQHHVSAAAEGSSSATHRADGGPPGREVASVSERAALHTGAHDAEQETDSRIYDTSHWPGSRSREQHQDHPSNARILNRRSEPSATSRPQGVIEAPRVPSPVHRSTQEQSSFSPLTTNRRGYQRPSVVIESLDHDVYETTTVERHVRFRPGPDSEINGIRPSRPAIREGTDFRHVQPFGVDEEDRITTQRGDAAAPSRTAPLPPIHTAPPPRIRDTDPALTGHRTASRPTDLRAIIAEHPPTREGHQQHLNGYLAEYIETQPQPRNRLAQPASRRRRFSHELCGPNCTLHPHRHPRGLPDNHTNDPDLDTDFALALAMSLEDRHEQRHEHRQDDHDWRHSAAIEPENPLSEAPRWPACEICGDKPQQVSDHGTGFCYGCYGEAQAAAKVLERETGRRRR